jgi:hypothetical protein
MHGFMIRKLYCQYGTNKIYTEDGVKTIYDILREGDIVYPVHEETGTPQWIKLSKPIQIMVNHGLAEVEKVWFNGKEKIHEVEFEDGEKYLFSINHKFSKIQENRIDWISLDKLRIGDEIQTLKPLKSGKKKISTIKIKSKKELGLKPTWNIDIKKFNYFILENGVVAYNNEN